MLDPSPPRPASPPPERSTTSVAPARPGRHLLRALAGAAVVVAGAAILASSLQPHRPERIHVTRLEIGVILAALGLIAATGAAALFSALRLVIGWLFPSRAPAGPARRAALAYLALGAFEVGALLWARQVEPLWLRTRVQRVELPGLQAPLRIAVISDLHSDGRFDLDRAVAERVNAARPDLILYLGDSLNQAERAPSLRAALTAMQARYGKLAIRGNWDVWYWGSIDLFRGTGFTELDVGWREVRAGPDTLRLGAHRFVDVWSPDAVVGRPPPGEGPAVLLYHANDYIPAAADAGVDLYLCGDTHGGQVEAPLWGALFSVGRQGRRYTRGLYRVGRLQAYVTPGIGVERTFPFRFGVRPEVTILDAVPAPGTPAR